MQMRREFLMVIVILISIYVSGCCDKKDIAEGIKSSTDISNEGEEEKYEIALVSFMGSTNDNSFGQATWDGIRQYAKEHSISYKLYQPEEATADTYVENIDLAIENGAKIVVCPGYLFETPIFIEQDKYPKVRFVLLDGQPHNASYTETRVEKNVLPILFQEEQAGFLAGYAAVKDGYTKLGFMGGMAVPAVIRYGYGFVQGCDFAATELGIDVEVIYHYTGTFFETPQIKTLASSWYQKGTQVIFACGGAIGNTVMSAAENSKAKVIGVDLDQSRESETVITSAMKMIKQVVYNILKDHYTGSFHGGTAQIYSVKNDGIGLPMATSKFNTFSQKNYDDIFAELKAGRISIYNKTEDSTTADLALKSVKVIYMK